MKKLTKSLLAILLCVVIFESCSTVPIIGRKQLSLLPESSMIQMGLTDYQAFMKGNKVSADQKATQMVQTSGSRIAAAVNKFLKDNGKASQIANYQWEFNLVADATANAWCMPGGKVVVYEGILPYTISEAGLAVVMGHEIAHALAHHGNERMSDGLVQELGGMALSKAIESKPEATRKIFQQAYGIGSQLAFILPYSRLHENEADRLGLILMAMAKYDPNEAVAFWERMSKSDTGNKITAWLSTHPCDEDRIASLKKNLPEALKYYRLALAGK